MDRPGQLRELQFLLDEVVIGFEELVTDSF
jgi:hypothetical protein